MSELFFTWPSPDSVFSPFTRSGILSVALDTFGTPGRLVELVNAFGIPLQTTYVGHMFCPDIALKPPDGWFVVDGRLHMTYNDFKNWTGTSPRGARMSFHRALGKPIVCLEQIRPKVAEFSVRERVDEMLNGVNEGHHDEPVKCRTKRCISQCDL